MVTVVWGVDEHQSSRIFGAASVKEILKGEESLILPIICFHSTGFAKVP